MDTIDRTTALSSLVTQQPAFAAVLERLNLDYCCGGDQSLEAACRAEDLDPDTVVRLLNASLGADRQTPSSASTDWTDAPLGALIDHIEATHHAYLRRTLPRLADRLATVARAHGTATPWIRDVKAIFDELKSDMEAHIEKEEDLVFPFIRSCTEGNAPPPPEALDGDPIALMEEEHDATGTALQRMRDLSDGFSAPADACATFQAALTDLENLEADTHRHVHKENHILFPRARALPSVPTPLN